MLPYMIQAKVFHEPANQSGIYAAKTKISSSRILCGWLKSEASLENILVNVALYGSLASCLGKRYVASETMELPAGSTFANLLHDLQIENNKRGYVFINSVLSDVPGLTAARDTVLNTGDHIGIFSLSSMWPYQYRDGVPMSEALKAAMAKFGAMHHSYENVAGQETGAEK